MARAEGSDEADPRYLAVDFANTVACPSCRAGDALGDEGEARRWTAREFPGLHLTFSRADLASLRRLRAHLRNVLRASGSGIAPPPASLSIVNRATRSSSAHGVRWIRGRFEPWEYDREISDSRRLMTEVARSAVRLLVGTSTVPVRPCAGAGCAHFVVARRPSQRWCSPSGCGNRARVQRHYRKVRSQRSSRARPSVARPTSGRRDKR